MRNYIKNGLQGILLGGALAIGGLSGYVRGEEENDVKTEQNVEKKLGKKDLTVLRSIMQLRAYYSEPKKQKDAPYYTLDSLDKRGDIFGAEDGISFCAKVSDENKGKKLKFELVDEDENVIFERGQDIEGKKNPIVYAFEPGKLKEGLYKGIWFYESDKELAETDIAIVDKNYFERNINRLYKETRLFSPLIFGIANSITKNNKGEINGYNHRFGLDEKVSFYAKIPGKSIFTSEEKIKKLKFGGEKLKFKLSDERGNIACEKDDKFGENKEVITYDFEPGELKEGRYTAEWSFYSEKFRDLVWIFKSK